MQFLSGIRVIEFSHMVMGPTAGLILGDLGADVIKVEPIGGDKTRNLPGSGAGYFAMFNRNKRSITLDLKSEKGRQIAQDLLRGADVVIENFRTGALDKLGLGPADTKALNPGVIYHSCKGFLSGPYENRTALDEVAQMMGGLAYMTGPSGRPLRAGTSVIDMNGAMFGVIGILAALVKGGKTGHGAHIKSALYETTAFLVGQHIAQKAVTGQPAPPMPERISAWAVYDVFDTQDAQVFIGVVSDGQWQAFCETFNFIEWGADPELATNPGRVAQRDRIIPALRTFFARITSQDLMQRLEKTGLPFAPIRRPEDLLNDPHLAEAGLADMTLPDGTTIRLPNLPVEIDGARAQVMRDPPGIGADSDAILQELGFDDQTRLQMRDAGIVG
ncbi:MAG: CaiB/BaiF CoA-transferase family protein [Pseudomonadota bacterium]